MSDPVLKIDYNEIPVTDMDAAKAFYSKAFGWNFIDYGPQYQAFDNAGIDGGLRLEERAFPTGALLILRADDIDAAERRVSDAGGIVGDKVDFPGGRRFHFSDPSGNELAVWSENGKYEPDAG